MQLYYYSACNFDTMFIQFPIFKIILRYYILLSVSTIITGTDMSKLDNSGMLQTCEFKLTQN